MVELEVDKEIKIPDDSTAKISSSSLFGGKFLEIVPGSSETFLKDKSVIYDTQTSLSPFTITSSTTKVDTRARGRYANIKIENTGAGESWRFGTFQVDLQPDGRRG